MTTYDSESTKWCPQHGYPLPCPKCGMGEYERGLQDGRKEVVAWVHYYLNLPELKGSITDQIIRPQWRAKLKEWGI
ncbi:MAG: hypothetical protein PHI12_14700 [Dehalococcoidales bacterium]|nr:hypothetical protein [Dehalococcoidales bacterium]